MKTKLTLFIAVLATALFAVGCNTISLLERDLTLEEKKVVGTYLQMDGTTKLTLVLLSNGVSKSYVNNKKDSVATWSMRQNEIFIKYYNFGATGLGITHAIHRLNPDESLTLVGHIVGGKRMPFQNSVELMYKKINSHHN